MPWHEHGHPSGKQLTVVSGHLNNLWSILAVAILIIMALHDSDDKIKYRSIEKEKIMLLGVAMVKDSYFSCDVFELWLPVEWGAKN